MSKKSIKKDAEISMNALPRIKTVIYDGSIIRLSNGYTKRAISVNTISSDMNNIESLVSY